jgi:hypothetical protein
MGMGVRSALGHGGIEVFVFVDDVALGSGVGDVSSQAINLLLHFRMLAPLADTLKIGLNLALELEAIASRAALEGVLDNVASQLLRGGLVIGRRLATQATRDIEGQD